MSNRDNAKNLIRQMVAAYNAKDAAAIAPLYADDVRLWSAIGPDVRGKTAALAHLQELFTTLPDEEMELETIVSDGETVVIEVTSRGTGPDGDLYEISFTEVFRVEGNRVGEIRTYIDPDDVADVSS